MFHLAGDLCLLNALFIKSLQLPLLLPNSFLQCFQLQQVYLMRSICLQSLVLCPKSANRITMNVEADLSEKMAYANLYRTSH